MDDLTEELRRKWSASKADAARTQTERDEEVECYRQLSSAWSRAEAYRPEVQSEADEFVQWEQIFRELWPHLVWAFDDFWLDQLGDVEECASDEVQLVFHILRLASDQDSIGKIAEALRMVSETGREYFFRSAVWRVQEVLNDKHAKRLLPFTPRMTVDQLAEALTDMPRMSARNIPRLIDDKVLETSDGEKRRRYRHTDPLVQREILHRVRVRWKNRQFDS